MIAFAQTSDALRPWLGGDFLSRNAEVAERVTHKLNAFTINRDEVPQVAQWVNDLLFLSVRDFTRGKMVLQMDDDLFVRVRVSDFALMVDDVLYLLFHNMPREMPYFVLVRDYSVRQGSLSALRALYLDYHMFQTPEEWDTVRRVITSCHEPFRFRAWINSQ